VPTVADDEIVTELRSLLRNDESPIELTEFGMVALVSWLPSNVQSSIEVMEPGIVTLVKSLLRNAPLPSEVTELGMVTPVS